MCSAGSGLWVGGYFGEGGIVATTMCEIQSGLSWREFRGAVRSSGQIRLIVHRQHVDVEFPVGEQ